MTPQTTPQQQDQSPPRPSDARPPIAEILQLAQKAPSVHVFLKRALETVAAAFGSPFAVIYARSGAAVVQEETHAGPSDPGFWRPGVERFLTESMTASKPRARVLSAAGAKLQVTLLAAPVSNARLGLGGTIAVVSPGGAPEARHKLERLESLATLVASAAATVGTTTDSGANALAANKSLARAATAQTPEELAFSITNNLRTRLGCEQVALGMVSGRRVKIMSISGLDEVKNRTPGVGRLRCAMEECLDFGDTIVSQPDGGWFEDGPHAGGFRLHQQWQQNAGGACVASVPLYAGKRCAAVLSLRRRGDEPFKPEQIEELRKAVEPFASALLLLHDARRGLARHACDAARAAVHTITGPGHPGRKVLAAAALLAAGWFCLGSLEYQLTVPARIVPAVQRHIAAPFDGTLASVAVVEGDVVHKGDVLCRFDQRDLLLQQGQLQSQIAVLQREQMRALAGNDPVSARLAEAKWRLAQTQLAAVARRIEQATLRAPFDGVVIHGDLRKQVGSVIAQGTPLYVVAPLDSWTLEMDIPENAADELAARLETSGGEATVGRFAGNARPEADLPLVVTRLRPSAEIRDGHNVYVAEARIEPDTTWMRPGMEGLARIDIGPRKVWWVALHNVLDTLRMKYWL